MTTLRTLECLVALVDHGSVSAAAAALHMSQPALSHQIASLEKELGTPVAERLWRGVRVTAAGRATAEEARVALRAAEQAVQIGQRVARADTGKIRISCAETMTAWLLLPVLRQWRSRRPDVHLELSEFTSADAMVDLLEAGQTDVAFGPRPYPHRCTRRGLRNGGGCRGGSGGAARSPNCPACRLTPSRVSRSSTMTRKTEWPSGSTSWPRSTKSCSVRCCAPAARALRHS